MSAVANIPSTEYVQQQIASQIATAVADKADISALETLSTKIGNFPDYSSRGWGVLYDSKMKEPGWPNDFLGTKTWDMPTNIGAVIEVLLGKNDVYDGVLSTVFSAIYTKLSSLTDRIVSVESKADTNASAISTRVDTAQTANQTMAGTYTVSGTMNFTGVAYVPTAELPPPPTDSGDSGDSGDDEELGGSEVDSGGTNPA